MTPAALARTSPRGAEGSELDKKPAWVPDWVWEEFVEGAYATAEGPAIFAQLLVHKEMEKVWASLERKIPRIQNLPKALVLADSVVMFREEFSGSGRLKLSERRALADKLKKASDQVVACMRGLQTTELGIIPDEIGGALEISLGKVMDDLGLQYGPAAFQRLRESYGIADAIEVHSSGNSLFSMEIYDSLPSILSAVNDAVSGWATTKPIVERPNSGDAERRYFLRRFTYLFRYWYGQPLRANTLAVTSIFFDCSDLDESTVATLAP
ncbi:hypothetical protein LYSHEL_25460 [Lysobacter helvus]|uniref:Uncharacterized protein n=2 Tax=Lysobacteraceae TaxID=32033 RepID=A0ABM7Q851_9GAMM|nr:hypothetical protein LYSCAS_25460 [Lysobacter caseinilyticus]BCT96675.1 hypothetical protein LYSHEL_25460 [Lysobacter helvus]